MAEIFVDNFAGAGGASTGIEQALGRPVDIAINHSRAALACHEANHPGTLHLCEDVFHVDPVAACAGRPVGGAWFSPDCFPAGTLVLTREGYRPIEQLEVGDEVLTHQRRWRPVTATMSSVRPLLKLRGHGHPGLLVSPEHPFYIRSRADYWNNAARRNVRNFSPATWTTASEVGKGSYWATPTEFPESEVPAVPVYKLRETAITLDLMWLAGRYIADGWTRLTETRAEIVITCGLHEVEGLRERLGTQPRAGTRSASNEMTWFERATGTAYQFTAHHRGLVEWLRGHFGHGAAEKLIPGWALGMDEDFRRALLKGYISGDGWRGDHGGAITECTTVSKALAFGIKGLAASLGKTVAVYTGPNTSVIQGRAVNARPSWHLRWRDDLVESHRQTMREGGLEWAPVRESSEASDGTQVFNLSVEEDESYVVDGIVVHNCTHHSRAKGGKPREKKTRGLAWIVLKWARTVRPRVIFLENVEEWLTWGPLDEHGQPIAARAGETFKQWLGRLRGLGYVVEWRSLVAADYGAPTTRKRLFLIARCDDRPIVWPEPTHGPGLLPYRTAAEIIDWSIPCPSIFGRKKPLADATLRRIAVGVRRYVLESARPFIVPVTHPRDARVHSIDEPLRTVTAANRGELALIAPTLVSHYGQSIGRPVTDPLATITAGGGGHQGLIAPTLIQTGYGEREGQAPRVLDLHAPLGTVVAGGAKHGLVAALLTKHYGGVVGHGVERPLGTVTATDHHAVTAAFLMKYYGTGSGQAPDEPLHTVTTKARFAAVRALLERFAGETTTGQRGLFDAPEPSYTVTVDGEAYVIADIGMRMLQPRELYRAQGFPESYVIDPILDGKPLNKGQQTAHAGNSVCPPIARALVASNLGQREWAEAAE